MHRYLVCSMALLLLAGCGQLTWPPASTSPPKVADYVSSYASEQMASPPPTQPIGVVASYATPAPTQASSQSAAEPVTTPWQTLADGRLVLAAPVLRGHLNDALETTPVGGTARWAAGPVHYEFAPNSQIYTSRQPPEWCRDGVLTSHESAATPPQTLTIRGLFCKPRGGRDWQLVR